MIRELFRYSLLLLVFAFLAVLASGLAVKAVSIWTVALALALWLVVLAQLSALRFALRLATLPLTLMIGGLGLTSTVVAQPLLTQIPPLIGAWRAGDWAGFLATVAAALQQMGPAQAVVAVAGLGFTLTGAWLVSRRSPTQTHYPDADRFRFTLTEPLFFTGSGNISLTNTDDSNELQVIGVKIADTAALTFTTRAQLYRQDGDRLARQPVTADAQVRIRANGTETFHLVAQGRLKWLGQIGLFQPALARACSVYVLPVSVETSRSISRSASS